MRAHSSESTLDRLLPRSLRTRGGRVAASLAGLVIVVSGGLLAFALRGARPIVSRSLEVAFICALLAVVVLELVLRAVIRRRGGYYRYAPHWRERLDQTGIAIPGLSPSSFVEVNADGERGDPAPSSHERCYRALVVGGSGAECYHLDQTATWSAVLQRILNEPEHAAILDAPRVHVGNVSRAIVPVDQMNVMLGKMLPRYRQLDLIVVMVGAADAVSWLEHGAPAALGPVEHSLDRLFEQHPEKRWGIRPSDTALWRTLSQWNRRQWRPVVSEPGLNAWLPRVRQMRSRSPHRIDETPDPTPMLARFEENLRILLELLRGTARRVILARQPWFGPDPTPEEEAMFWNFGLGRPYKEQVSTYLTPRAVDTLMRAIDQRAADVATAMGIEQVDVGSQIEHSRHTFYDELHFTPAGAEAVGRLVAAVVLRLPPR